MGGAHGRVGGQIGAAARLRVMTRRVVPLRFVSSASGAPPRPPLRTLPASDNELDGALALVALKAKQSAERDVAADMAALKAEIAQLRAAAVSASTSTAVDAPSAGAPAAPLGTRALTPPLRVQETVVRYRARP